MRLIMTTVYNAYHSLNLSQTAAFLASNECKSFKDFQRIRACQCSFRQFCQLLANGLTFEVASSLNYNEDERMTIDEASVQEVIVYNKREAKSKNCLCSMFSSNASQLCLVLSSGPFTSQVFKCIADMAGKPPGYVLPAMSLFRASSHDNCDDQV
jgi:hypothetical protein